MQYHRATNIMLKLCIKICYKIFVMGCQSYPIINRREARYMMHAHFKQVQEEWKGTLLSVQNMGKGLHKVFKAVVNETSEALPILG